MENTENIMFSVIFSVICPDPTRRIFCPIGGGVGPFCTFLCYLCAILTNSEQSANQKRNSR